MRRAGPDRDGLAIPDRSRFFGYASRAMRGLVLKAIAAQMNMQADSGSFLNADEAFVPSLGLTPGAFTMVDLLTYAGVGGRR